MGKDIKYRTVTGIHRKVSALCLGTGPFGSGMNEEASFAQLDRFAELGGNFLDSAHVYGAWEPGGVNGGCGNSEVVVGRWLKHRNCREKMIVATKGGHPDFVTKESGMTKKVILQQIHESLDHLKTDYIDMYWLHRDDRSIPVSEILGWFEEPIKQGLIRAVGCSHWRTDRLAEALKIAENSQKPMIQASQIAWSLAEAENTCWNGPYGEQLAMDGATWNFHTESGLMLAAYNSQAAGFFAGKYDGLDFSSPEFPKPELAKNYGSESNMKRRTVAMKLAGEKGCTPNQIALAWLLNQPFPTVAIFGPRTMEQLVDSMGAVSVDLSPEEVEALREG